MGPLHILDWGRLEYELALRRQLKLVEKRIAEGIPDHLILVEHPPVVTLGMRGGQNDLLLKEEHFSSVGVAVCKTNRGGKATYHGLAQLVAYPIIKLLDQDLHRYVRILLESVAVVLRKYGLDPEVRSGEPGIWVRGRKIASIGVAVKSWVTYHGIALNVSTDLTPFTWIVPCGKPLEAITSMEKELGIPVDLASVKELFLAGFKESFNYTETYRPSHPAWLMMPMPDMAAVKRTEKTLISQRLCTVCQSAHCPNLGECFGRGTATFMILGSVCTRNCRFCAIDKGCPQVLDEQEPDRVAQAAREMRLNYVVVTSVTRDDLVDGGASQFARTIQSIRREVPEAAVEILIPDFQGCPESLEIVLRSRPDVLNHNIETVPRLYPSVRPQADYRRSLDVLRRAADYGLPVKSGLMLGLGEKPREVRETLRDLRGAGCGYLTLGQYLAPSERHVPVYRYVTPQEFAEWEAEARAMGFSDVASGPLVRSSYRADSMGSPKPADRCSDGG
jgi:lipoic acid synthetase